MLLLIMTTGMDLDASFGLKVPGPALVKFNKLLLDLYGSGEFYSGRTWPLGELCQRAFPPAVVGIFWWGPYSSLVALGQAGCVGTFESVSAAIRSIALLGTIICNFFLTCFSCYKWAYGLWEEI